ncbi:MAG: hypothetical protein AAFP18_02335 [Bacteroidota bacterium]
MNDAYRSNDAFRDDPFDDAAFDEFDGLRFFAPRTATQVIGDAIEFVRANLRDLLEGISGFVGPAFAASLLAGTAALWLLVGDVSIGLGVTLAVLSAIGLAVTLLLFNAACYAYLWLYHEEGPGMVTPSLLRAETGHLFWPLFGLAVLIALLSGAAQLITLVPLLGILVYLVLYVAFLPVLLLPPAIYTLRGAELVESIVRAYELVKLRWGQAFLTTLLLYLLLMVGFFVASFVPGFVGGLVVASLGLSGLVGALAFVPMALTMLVLAVVGIFFWNAGAALLYGSLVEQAEGVTLSARVDALDDLDAPNAPPSW